jgi:ABC-type histidine transport system ATPase subunit
MEHDKKVFEFRKAINEWKRTTLFPKLNDEVDTGSTDRRIDEAHDLFTELMRKVGEAEKNHQTPVQSGGDQTIPSILATLGSEDTWDQSLLDRVRSSLLTDLWEYPLTFNTRLIDQFKETPNYPIFE